MSPIWGRRLFLPNGWCYLIKLFALSARGWGIGDGEALQPEKCRGAEKY